jgi:L-malate glycosyltransferase
VENQSFVVPLEAAALAEAIAALARDVALRARVGAANRAKAAAEFDEAVMVAAWGALFG